MSLDELTKSQIVLLTLLVSFVTSIATGIVTISLMDQAPPAVTQTVSHIIRETVQKAVPAVISQSAGVIQSSESKQEEPPTPQLPEVIARAERSIVRLYSGTGDSAIYLGLGVIIDAGGTMATDHEAFGGLKRAAAFFSNGSSTPVIAVGSDASRGLLYLSVVSTSSPMQGLAATIAKETPVGEQIIGLSGKSTLRIASGLVVAAGEDTSLGFLFTDLPAATIMKGEPIINTRGEFVGLSTGIARTHEAAAFVPIVPYVSKAEALPKRKAGNR